MSDDITKLLEKEKEELSKRRDAILTELDEIQKRMAAINAYDRAITGRVAPSAGRKPEVGGLKDNIFQIIRKNGPIRRKEIADLLGIQEEKEIYRMANAINSLKVNSKIAIKDGSYIAIE